MNRYTNQNNHIKSYFREMSFFFPYLILFYPSMSSFPYSKRKSPKDVDGYDPQKDVYEDDVDPEVDNADYNYQDSMFNDEDSNLSNFKRTRIRKKGRKARFQVDLYLRDQQIMVNQAIAVNHQTQNSHYIESQQNPCQEIRAAIIPTSNRHNFMTDLESVGPNHIPNVINIVPRGFH